MIESELKFEISSSRLKNVEFAMLDSKAVRQRLQARYFDTPDGALTHCGIVVRLGKEGKRWVQTAKGQTRELLERLEYNSDLPLQSARTLPALDLLWQRGTPKRSCVRYFTIRHSALFFATRIRVRHDHRCCKGLPGSDASQHE